MLNQAICPYCRKDGWTIKIDYKKREAEFTCMNCGHQEYLRELFGKRKVKIKKDPEQGEKE